MDFTDNIELTSALCAICLDNETREISCVYLFSGRKKYLLFILIMTMRIVENILLNSSGIKCCMFVVKLLVK